MSDADKHRLQDVLLALDAIERHLQFGGLDTEVVFDAVRMRLLEIGEAVRALPSDVLARRPEIPWRDVVVRGLLEDPPSGTDE